MELIYSVKCKQVPQKPVKNNSKPICALSDRNTIAFTSSTPHEEPPEETLGKLGSDFYHRVYVADIDQPWQVFQVCETRNKVTLLDWHPNCTELLVVTEDGLCEVFTMQKNLLNRWHLKMKALLTGEEILAVKWLEQGQNMMLVADKKDSNLFSEKVVRQPSQPLLTGHAKLEQSGLIGLTASGVVFVGLIPSLQVGESPRGQFDLLLYTETLDTNAAHLSLVDLEYKHNGEVKVITSTGSGYDPIKAYSIKLERVRPLTPDTSCKLTITMDAGFYLGQSTLQIPATTPITPMAPTNSGNTPFPPTASAGAASGIDDKNGTMLTHLNFMPNDDGRLIVIATEGCQAGSQVQLWRRRKVARAVARVFQNGAESRAEKTSVEEWSHLATVTHTSQTLSLAFPRFPIRYGSVEQGGQFFQYIAVAYHDGAIKIISKHGFQSMTTTNLDIGGLDDLEASGGRRPSAVPCVTSMQQSLTGAVLLGVDQMGSLYLMKVLNTRDPVSQVTNSYMAALVEYLMVTGLDLWDVMVILKPSQAETVMQMCVSDFNLQPHIIRDIFQLRHLRILANLCLRCPLVPINLVGGRASGMMTGSYASGEYRCRLMLGAIMSYCFTLTGPVSASGQLDASQRIKGICASSSEVDLDKLAQGLHGPVGGTGTGTGYNTDGESQHLTDFTVDSVTLQALQPLLQWVADVALYLLIILPSTNSNPVPQGTGLLRDPLFMSNLREILLLSRIWTVFYCSGCSPRFSCNQNTIEPVSQLYGLLTQAWLSLRDRQPTSQRVDWDENLIDKCCMLPSQIHLSHRKGIVFSTGSNLYRPPGVLSNPAFPITYVFNRAPDSPQNSSSPTDLPWPFKQRKARNCMDSVNHISLGHHPSQAVKECCRCGAVTLMPSLARSRPAIKGWESRWYRNCGCGGLWGVRDNIQLDE